MSAIFPIHHASNRLVHPVSSSNEDDTKIEKSAKDFESLLLSGWLQQAEDSFAKLPGGDDEADADPGSSQLQGIAMQSLGASLTESGGIGMAKMIAGQLRKSGETNTSPPPKAL